MQNPEICTIDVKALKTLVPHPAPDANKYTRGVVTVIAGSRRFPGAAVLAASASSRCGAGYTTLATPASAATAARCQLGSIPVLELPEWQGTLCLASWEVLSEEIKRTNAFVIGPGIQHTSQTKTFLKQFCENIKEPTVFDADALNILGPNHDFIEAREGCVNVYTPHDGEARRFLGRNVIRPAKDCAEIAAVTGGVVVLKGPDTYLSQGDGKVYEFKDAGPELAKAGSGDCLAGMIGGFLSQGMDPMDAAKLAVYLHASAGALVARELTDVSAMPEDLLAQIGVAIRKLEEE